MQRGAKTARALTWQRMRTGLPLPRAAVAAVDSSLAAAHQAPPASGRTAMDHKGRGVGEGVSDRGYRQTQTDADACTGMWAECNAQWSFDLECCDIFLATCKEMARWEMGEKTNGRAHVCDF